MQPEEVDLIFHTHLHSDHVGWNTRLVHGCWVPTFPNVEVVCSDLEWRYGAALADGDETAIDARRDEAGLGEPIRVPVSGTFAGSLRPLDGHVPIRRIPVDGATVFPGICFFPTPGHSICHAAIELVSDGEIALFSGDVFHHPVEIHDPTLVSMFCEFPSAVAASRRQFMDRARDGCHLLTGHFPRSSVGHIERRGSNYRWTFADHTAG